MTEDRRSQEVDDYVGSLEPSLRRLAERLRELVLGVDDEIVEEFKWNQPTYERDGMICYFTAEADYLRFGFWRGTGLRDPDTLLEGTGERMRHVKIHDEGDVREELFREWVREAVSLNEEQK